MPSLAAWAPWECPELWKGSPQASREGAGRECWAERKKKKEGRPAHQPQRPAGALSGQMGAAGEEYPRPEAATYQVPLLGKLGVRGLLVHISFGPSLYHLLLQPLHLQE